MVANALLFFVAVSLFLALREYRKGKMADAQRIYDLTVKLDTYGQSEKVIKDCVVYSAFPLTIEGSGMAFIDCKFEDLRKRPATPELNAILGIKS